MKLLFELDPYRVATVDAVLCRLRASERAFLRANPRYLGVRCEAYLAGEAPEWFEANGFLSEADRLRIGMLACETLAGTA